jgi:hypothetical protein
VIYNETLNAADWVDGGLLTFSFEQQKKSEGRIYTITFTGVDGELGYSAPTLWYSSAQLDGAVMKWNGVVQNGTLQLQMTYGSIFWIIWIVIGIGVLIIVSYIMMLKREEDNESDRNAEASDCGEITEGK